MLLYIFVCIVSMLAVFLKTKKEETGDVLLVIYLFYYLQIELNMKKEII